MIAIFGQQHTQLPASLLRVKEECKHHDNFKCDRLLKKRSGHTFWIFSYFIQTFFSSSLYVVALLVFKIRGMSWKGEQLIAHRCICMLQHWSEDVSCSSSSVTAGGSVSSGLNWGSAGLTVHLKLQAGIR